MDYNSRLAGFKNKVVANQQMVFILIATAAFIGLAYYVYVTYVAKDGYVANKEFVHSTGDNSDMSNNTTFQQVNIYFFQQSDCTFSRDASQVWNEWMNNMGATLRQSNDNENENKMIIHEKIYNGKYLLNLINVNCDDGKHIKLLDKYNVQGFPTIVLQNGSDVIEYNAKANIKTLNHFISSVLV